MKDVLYEVRCLKSNEGSYLHLIIFPHENSGLRCQYSKESEYDVLLDVEFFVRPHKVVGKHLVIFHLGEGESTVLLRTNWKMSLTYPP